MSCVVGIDISTFGIDLISLDENTNKADWHHLHLEGKSVRQARQVLG
jgi:hypothetical protein